MHHHHILNDTLSAEPCNTDIAAIASQTIARYGEKEWRYALLTSELHGHIGIYALLGVKMGLFARELLGAEAGSLHVVSYAGSKPPVSCLNDGLQVATEATLGHGLIEVIHPFTPCAEAEFSTRQSTIRLRLKNEQKEMIEDKVQSLTALYGRSDGYWHNVRQFALECWSEWNRKDIFELYH